jgi:heme exporter protein D
MGDLTGFVAVGDVASFLAMGGYAAFVWPAFALTLLVLGGLLLGSLRTLRAREAELRALEAGRGDGRGRRARAKAATP